MDYTLVITEIGKVLFGVVIGTFITGWYKDFKSKKEDRKRLFLRLVAAKGYIKLPQSLIDDVNMIELIFRNNKKVIEKYRIYYDEICSDPPNYEKQVAYYWDLLRIMGDCVGYKNVDNKTLRNGYTPNSSLNEHKYQDEYQKAVLPFLKEMTELAKAGTPLNELLTEHYEAMAEKAANEKKPDEAKDEQTS